jgi:hypothetical protein
MNRDADELRGAARREVGLPGESFLFEVADPGSSHQDFVWSGGESPPTGQGPRFATVFNSGGDHVVTARSGARILEFRVSVCPIDEWLERASSFFGPSVDLSKVTVKMSWLALGRPGTAWTCNDVIRFKRPRRSDGLPREATLIHELGHVWEHQSGQAQLLRGLVEQLGRLLGRDPYDFGGPEGVRRATALTRFTKEGQAQIIEEHWKSLNGYNTDHKRIPLTTPGYSSDLERLVQGAGIGRRSGSRRSVWSTIDAVIARIVNAAVTLVERPDGRR